MLKRFLNQKVIIRTYSAGVHFGTLNDISEDGKCCVLTDTQRVHYWEGAASLSQMTLEGVKVPYNCRITVEIPQIVLTETIEILPLSESAFDNLKNVPVWKM